MHTQFITGKRALSRKLNRRQDQYRTALIAAHIDADMSHLPQTIWLTNDKDAPFMSLANGSEFKPELRAKPIVTVLPVNYF